MTKLRPWQVTPAARLLEILRIGNAVDMSETGTGKCLGKGTPILMFDGSIRAVETVEAGEEIMGDDGTSRKVLQTSRGKGPLFKITPKGNGQSWICNGDHILVLNSTSLGLPYRNWARGEIKEISVNQYLTLPKHERVSRWKLFYSAGWEGRESSLVVDPYIYGLWLGDGAISHGGLTTADAPIKRAWGDYFLRKGFRIREERQVGNAATTYVPACNPATKVGKTNKQMRPNFWRRFITLSCNQKNKFIYPEYLKGSQAQRRALLAGLLDSDGYLCNGLNTFEISQKSEKLSEQISFLARSLGFKVSVKRNFKTCQTGGGGWYFRLLISGDTATVPTILARKKATPRSLFKRHNVFGFSITPAGEGEYFGFIIDGNRRFLLGDFTVTHNTAHAAHVIAELKLPTLVICPKIAVTSWRRMLEHFGTSASVTNWEAVAVGNTPYGTWEKPATKETRGKFFFVCQNCQRKYKSEETPDRCYATSNGVHCFSRKPVKHKRGRFSWHSEIRFIVADECHRAGAMKSLNAELVIAARRQEIKLLGLSATLATTPLGFRAWGYALDLFSNPDASFFSWSRRHGCGRIPALPGWHVIVGAERQREYMARINAEVLPSRGVRVRTQDIPDFPERQIIPELYDIENPEEINKAYSNAAKSTGQNVDCQSPLTEILRARQRAELAKVGVFVELTEDEMAKGNSVAIFVNFTATLAELRLRLKTDCVVDGSVEGVARRDANIQSFQSNERNLILLNSAAGGVSVSLQDLTGEHPRVGLVSPSFSATEFRQVCGRLHRAGGKSKCLYRIVMAANTVEEKIFKALKQKEACMDALTDGDLFPI